MEVGHWTDPDGGTYRGLAEAEAHFSQARETWAEGSCEPERFVVAGATFAERVTDHDYPHDKDACIFCRQPLGPKEVDLITRYQEFANDSARKRANDALESGDADDDV